MAIGLWLLATPASTLLPDGAQLILFSLAVYLALGVDLRGSVLASRRGRQVPATWLQRFGAVRAYAAYGFLLGGGLITFVPFALAYVAFIAGALYAPAWLVVAVGAGFRTRVRDRARLHSPSNGVRGSSSADEAPASYSPSSARSRSSCSGSWRYISG